LNFLTQKQFLGSWTTFKALANHGLGIAELEICLYNIMKKNTTILILEVLTLNHDG